MIELAAAVYYAPAHDVAPAQDQSSILRHEAHPLDAMAEAFLSARAFGGDRAGMAAALAVLAVSDIRDALAPTGPHRQARRISLKRQRQFRGVLTQLVGEAA